MLLQNTISDIKALDQAMMNTARTRVDALVKPVNSLGALEELAVKLAGISGVLHPVVKQKTMVVMAADHGVYEEGISSNPQQVTFAQTMLIAKGMTGVGVLAKTAGATVTTVDIGVKGEFPRDAGVIDQKIKNGTDNMAQGPAMTREEAIRSIEVGIQIAQSEIEKGAQVLGTGEMGIGNTTASTAILAVLGNFSPEDITGNGAGTASIAHKANVIQQAIKVNQPNKTDALDVLAKVGGLEIGGMTGVMLGAAAKRVPVVVDGYISTIAALLAVLLEPKVKGYLIASHASAEPGGQKASELLGIRPVLHMKLCLGEGSGAALAFPLLDAACNMNQHMATFSEAGLTI